MKYFIITILCCLPLLAVAQDSLVTIKASTARYFLEVHDEVFILREKDSICNELVYNLSTENNLKDLIIGRLQGDTLIYLARENAFKDNIKWVENDLDRTERALRKSQFRGTVLLGAGSGALIGSAFPGAGTLIGTALGAGVGAIVALIKR